MEPKRYATLIEAIAAIETHFGLKTKQEPIDLRQSDGRHYACHLVSPTGVNIIGITLFLHIGETDYGWANSGFCWDTVRI